MTTHGKILLAGGGTAGHVNPLLAVAAELERRGWEVGVVGTAEGLEAELVPAAGFSLTAIPRAPLPRRPSPELLSLPVRLREAQRTAATEIGEAAAVVGFGGYVSVPAYRAATRLEVPFVIHEQNARPGLANRLGARNAAAVALTFPATELRARRGVTEVTGLPLRAPIAELVRKRSTEAGASAARQEAAQRLGLAEKQPTLLITGGSLGALHLNEATLAAAQNLPPGAQVLHLTGKGKDKAVRDNLPEEVADRWHVIDYLPEMELALAAADLVLCRAGAGTVAELSALGLPAIYVPLAIGNGEQRLNAADAVAVGGAELVPDADFTAATVTELVFPTLANPELLKKMGRAAKASSVGDGTQKVADLVEEVARG